MRIWIKGGRRAVEACIEALKGLAVRVHSEARRETDSKRAAELRREADEADDAADDIRNALHREDKL